MRRRTPLDPVYPPLCPPLHVTRVDTVRVSIWNRVERDETTLFHVGISRFDLVDEKWCARRIDYEHVPAVERAMEAAFKWIVNHLVELDPDDQPHFK